MSTSHTGQLVPWPIPVGPPTLPSHALRAAQATTLAAPRLRYDPFSRLMFLTVNVLYGRRPSLAKFLVLEHLARDNDREVVVRREQLPHPRSRHRGQRRGAVAGREDDGRQLPPRTESTAS